MASKDRLQLARDSYGAYESGDRSAIEDLHRFRNTEVLTFTGDKLAKAEVYFGWDLE